MREAVVRAALFPIADLLPPPAGHPDRVDEVSGVPVVLRGGLRTGLVFPESVRVADFPRVVDDVREWLRGEGRATAVWFVPEVAEPADLAERLQEFGLTRNDTPPFESRYASMAAAEAPPGGPPDVEVRRVGSIDELRQAWRVAARAFGMDAPTAAAYAQKAELAWEFESGNGASATFVAAVQGELVGFAESSFGRSAAYLGGSGTHPDFRGRGIYRALVRARWDAAVARGTPALTITAGAMSRPILERLGFAIVGWSDCLLDDLAPVDSV